MRAADLFCGGGGSSTGLRTVPNLNLVLGIDFDANALRTYALNHSHESLLQDISDVKSTIEILKKRGIQIICASPPCQDFSNAGLRVESERANLTALLADIVVGANAEGLIMENVTEMLGSEAFGRFEKTLLDANYHILSFTIDASKVGVPQRRNRAFVVASKGSLEPLRHVLEAAAALETVASMTPRKALLDLRSDFYLVVPRNNACPAVVSADRAAPTLRTNCASFMKDRTKYVRRFRDAGPIAEAMEMTVRQLGMLSGFPGDYKWPSVRSQAGRQIGNAVCPPVMEWVAKQAVPAFGVPRGEDEEAVHLRPDPPTRTASGARRCLYLIGAARGAELDCETVHALARASNVNVFRTSPSLVLRYKYGTDAETDAKAKRLTQGCIRQDWVLEVRERGIANNCTDDLYWFVPTTKGEKTKMVMYRSCRELCKAGLVPPLR